MLRVNLFEISKVGFCRFVFQRMQNVTKIFVSPEISGAVLWWRRS